MVEQNEEQTYQSLATRVRMFFRDLFGSRYVERLEMDLAMLRNDFENRLQDKDRVIAELREERAALQSKVVTYETTLLPHASRAGADIVKTTSRPEKPNFPNFIMDKDPMETKWQRVQRLWNEKQEKEEAEAAAKEAEANTAA